MCERCPHEYEALRSEIAADAQRLRRKVGEINNRLYFTEDGERERALQTKLEEVQAELSKREAKVAEVHKALNAAETDGRCIFSDTKLMQLYPREGSATAA